MLAEVLFILALAVIYILCMRRIMKRDNFINHLIVVFYDNGEMSRESLITEIYTYACADYRLKRIVAKHKATEDDFRKIFDKLIYWGNFKKGHRYVPISSFFYVSSLEKILKNKDEDAKKLTIKMMNHFHI